MVHRIEVIGNEESANLSNPQGKDTLLLKKPVRVYNIKDNSLSQSELEDIAELFGNKLVDKVAIDKPVITKLSLGSLVIEKSLKPGVNDPEGLEVQRVLSRILKRQIGPVSSSMQYVYKGDIDDNRYTGLIKNLGNPLVNSFRKISYSDWDSENGAGFNFPDINLVQPTAFNYVSLDMSDEQLLEVSKKRYLALGIHEMRAIKELFVNKKFASFWEKRAEAGLEKMSTDAELESFGAGLSDHCLHTTWNGLWKYTSEDPNDEACLSSEIDSLFKTLIRDVTYQIVDKKPEQFVSIFEQNAGAVLLNHNWIIAHKVESHNHPSALDGEGGSGTGIGGVIRDTQMMGQCMETRSTQFAFRTAHPNFYTDLPSDIQTPARTLETIILGVEGYGNKIGVPTQCGSVMIHESSLKPTVIVGATSVAPREINGKGTHLQDVRPGYVAVSLGGRVGKDGIHGASGSSITLDAKAEASTQVNQSVQIGNPIIQKGVFDVSILLRDAGLVEASQDCGAGGWHSAVGELAGLCDELEQQRLAIARIYEKNILSSCSSIIDLLAAAAEAVPDINRIASPRAELLREEIRKGEIFSYKREGRGGVRMDLTHAPEKYTGLTGWEKHISESQERCVIVVRPENVNSVLDLCRHEEVEATIVGKFDDSGIYHVLDQNQSIVFLPMEYLHKGAPQRVINASWKKQVHQEPEISVDDDLTNDMLNFIGQPNLQSYSWIFERYDHEVQGGSVLKPIVGLGRGKSDAIAYHAVLGQPEVVIETWGSNPLQGDIDTYHMGRNNIVDAIGKVVAAGGSLDRIYFNGNAMCPPPQKDTLDAAKTLRMVKGVGDAELMFDAPTISGKDSPSMQREYISTKDNKTRVVKGQHEMLMSALAIIPDSSTITSPDFKLPGDYIFVVGKTNNELGASELYRRHSAIGNTVPCSNLQEIRQQYANLEKAIHAGFVHSAQYVAKGGLAAALTNSSLAGDLGYEIDIGAIDEEIGRPEVLLTSETTGRFVVSVSPNNTESFKELMGKTYVREIGNVRNNKYITINYNERTIVQTDVPELRSYNKGGIY